MLFSSSSSERCTTYIQIFLLWVPWGMDGHNFLFFFVFVLDFIKYILLNCFYASKCRLTYRPSPKSTPVVCSLSSKKDHRADNTVMDPKDLGGTPYFPNKCSIYVSIIKHCSVFVATYFFTHSSSTGLLKAEF